MTSPYSFEVKRDPDGRIVEKIETVSGESTVWAYSYDKEGRLTEAWLDGRLVCRCDYDRGGRRIRDLFPLRCGNSYRNYAYRMDNRLMQAGDNRYTHDEQGLRSIWSHRGSYTTYRHAADYRLLEVHQEEDDVRYSFEHDEEGRRVAKYRNGRMAEAYTWLDFIRLAGFYDGEHIYEFAYEDNARTPYAMYRDDGAEARLYYDQVGSLRVVADSRGKVIKEILYDPFGSIIEDTNPSLSIPIGFAGGLHDRDLGFVRFGWRDYDPNTARWTAPDPLGDAGGDKDWYGYCLDDPVNGVDPLGLYLHMLPEMEIWGAWALENLDGVTELISRYPEWVKEGAKYGKQVRDDYYSDLYGREKIDLNKQLSDARRKSLASRRHEALSRISPSSDDTPAPEGEGGGKPSYGLRNSLFDDKELISGHNDAKKNRERPGWKETEGQGSDDGSRGGEERGASGNIGRNGGSYNEYGR